MRKARAPAVMVIAAAAILAAGCSGPRATAREFIEGNREEIRREILDSALPRTNLNAGEAAVVRAGMARAEQEVHCRNHPNMLLLSQRSEVAQRCQVNLAIREPLLVQIVADYDVHMPDMRRVEQRSSYWFSEKYPVIDHGVASLTVHGFRQGILRGETRNPGIWRLEE